MEESIRPDRFELKNYKNVLIFDDEIVISNNFYQSTDHFLYREKNSKKDRLILKENIHKIVYNSIGNDLKIYFKRRKRKLIFHSNKTRDEFLEALKPAAFLNKTEENAVPTTKIASILFVFTVLMVIIFYYTKLESLLSMERFLFLVLGLVVAIYTLFKKILKSVNVTYLR